VSAREGGTIRGAVNRGRFAAKVGTGTTAEIPKPILAGGPDTFEGLGLGALVCICLGHRKKEGGISPALRNRPFRGALAAAPPSDQSLTITTYPATIAARLAVPINTVASIMGSPPWVFMFRGERKDGAGEFT
jgi:hypothetical protein